MAALMSTSTNKKYINTSICWSNTILFQKFLKTQLNSASYVMIHLNEIWLLPTVTERKLPKYTNANEPAIMGVQHTLERSPTNLDTSTNATSTRYLWRISSCKDAFTKKKEKFQTTWTSQNWLCKKRGFVYGKCTYIICF